MIIAIINENFPVFSARCACHPLSDGEMPNLSLDKCVIDGTMKDCFVHGCPRWMTGMNTSKSDKSSAEREILEAVKVEHAAWLRVANKQANREEGEAYYQAYGLYRLACARHL